MDYLTFAALVVVALTMVTIVAIVYSEPEVAVNALGVLKRAIDFLSWLFGRRQM